MCTLSIAAAVAALTAVIVPGLAAAADGGASPVLRSGSVPVYAGGLLSYPGEPANTGAATTPYSMEPVAAPGAAVLTRQMSEAWAFPAEDDWSASGRDAGRWSFASVTVPFAWSPHALNLASGSLSISPLSAPAGGAAAITQLVAGYHITPNDRIAVSYDVIAATSTLQSGRRSKAAYNFWTFTPKVAYIKTMPGSDRDTSTIVAVGLFSRTTTAIYQNSAVGRIETLVMRQTTGGWGYGGVAAAIEHYTLDPTVPSYGMPHNPNFNGAGLGVGPQLNWNTTWRGGTIEFRYRWIYEFNGPGGRPIQPMLLSATVHL
jgi:hypothetical protein